MKYCQIITILLLLSFLKINQQKKYIIEEIKNLEPQVTDNGNIKFSVTREDDSFIFFFNSKTFDLVGWKTIDIYQNVVIFEISNVQKNIDIDKKLFKLPAVN